MRYLFSSFVFLSVGLLAMSAIADPSDKDAKKGDDKGLRRNAREDAERVRQRRRRQAQR